VLVNRNKVLVGAISIQNIISVPLILFTFNGKKKATDLKISKEINKPILICLFTAPGICIGRKNTEYVWSYIWTKGKTGMCYSRQMEFSHQIRTMCLFFSTLFP